MNGKKIRLHFSALMRVIRIIIPVVILGMVSPPAVWSQRAGVTKIHCYCDPPNGFSPAGTDCLSKCGGRGRGSSRSSYDNAAAQTGAMIGMMKSLIGALDSFRSTGSGYYDPNYIYEPKMTEMENPQHRKAYEDWKRLQMNPGDAKPFFAKLLEIQQRSEEMGEYDPLKYSGIFDSKASDLAGYPDKWTEAYGLLNMSEGLLNGKWGKVLDSFESDVMPVDMPEARTGPVDLSDPNVPVIKEDGVPKIESFGLQEPVKFPDVPSVEPQLQALKRQAQWRRDHPIQAKLQDLEDCVTCAKVVATAIILTPGAKAGWHLAEGKYEEAAMAYAEDVKDVVIGKMGEIKVKGDWLKGYGGKVQIPTKYRTSTYFVKPFEGFAGSYSEYSDAMELPNKGSKIIDIYNIWTKY